MIRYIHEATKYALMLNNISVCYIPIDMNYLNRRTDIINSVTEDNPKVEHKPQKDLEKEKPT